MKHTWQTILDEEKKQFYFSSLQNFLTDQYEKTTVYPPRPEIMNAMKLCPFQNIKVVIIGQDPYHGEGQANGLAFSVNDGQKIPPSLLNIFREMRNSTGEIPIRSGNLQRWAKQGVLLLNSVMSVEKDKPGSHANMGWERFTDSIIKKINDEKTGVVFLLWGNYAKTKEALINPNKHAVLTAAHPSPLSAHRGFLGCDHFHATNTYLALTNKEPIDWR